MILQWSDGPEPFALRCTGICPSVGSEAAHAHIEAVTPLGNGESVLGFTMSAEDCHDLATLFFATEKMIRNVSNWSTTGLDQLEDFANHAAA